MINAKVKVSREVAEIIKALRGVVSDTTLIKIVSAECSGDNPVLTSAIAIHHGYEIEQTPAEKVAEYYLNSVVQANPAYRKGIQDALMFVTEAYGLKIEGVDVK